MGFRTCSFVVLMAFFLTSVLWNSLPARIAFMLFAAGLAYGGVWEFLTLTEQLGRKSFRRATAIAGALIVALCFVINSFHSDLHVRALVMISVIAVACWVSVLFCGNSRNYFEKILNSLPALALIVLPLLPLVMIYEGKGQHSLPGNYLLLYLILVTKSGDTGAYLTGTLFNWLLKGHNHKIVPSISPKKSWEGTIGGLILSVVLSVVLWKYMLGLQSMTIPVIAGAVLFLGGFAGDLAESVMKRIVGVKDSGRIFPGMGGVLDVVDSLLLNAPLFYFFFVPFI